MQAAVRTRRPRMEEATRRRAIWTAYWEEVGYGREVCGGCIVWIRIEEVRILIDQSNGVGVRNVAERVVGG